jgi:glycosyltransferase involved in cell wall biosynthesis
MRVGRVVFVTQQADPSHPFLAATVPQIRALAERVDEVVVLADSAAPEGLPANCRVRSFAAPRRALRGVRFVLALAAELRRPRGLVVLAHMCPIYAVLAAPLARPLRVPVLLWFTQQRAGRLLALADRLVNAIVTVDVRSVPLRSPKVLAVGHGIDPAEFPCVEHDPGDALRLLSLGRYSAAKRHDVAVRAVRMLIDRGLDACLTVRGPEATARDADVRASLAGLVRELGLEQHVTLADAVRRDAIPALFADVDVLVNASESGSADKVVFEAALSGLPPCAASPVFDVLLPETLRFPPGDPAALAERLAALAELSAEDRGALGRELRARVEAEHSAGHWAEEMLRGAAS